MASATEVFGDSRRPGDVEEFFASSKKKTGGFLKWWYPTTMGFPTKIDHFGVFWGYHHLRKHPTGQVASFFLKGGGLYDMGFLVILGVFRVFLGVF